MITAIIIDDEKNAREFLSKVIHRYFQKKIIVLESCDSVRTGVIAINKHQPDLVFLDIQMPGENGFGLFKHFDVINFEVIFTTAYADFAIDAIRHSALDYLLKPINYVDLLSAIKRFDQQRTNKNQQKKISLLLDHLGNQSTYFHKIALPTQNGYEFVKLNSIVYCQSESNYCKVVCLDGKEYLLAKTLKFVEQLLDNDLFCRIHKSYLINLNYIEKFDKGSDMKVTLSNGIQLPISVRKKEHFLNAIQQKN